jgi:hypothetical protein
VQRAHAEAIASELQAQAGFEELLEHHAVDVRDSQGMIVPLPANLTSWDAVSAAVLDAPQGRSVVLKPEQLPDWRQAQLAHVASDAIAQDLRQRFQTSVTQHLYFSARNAMALQPHTDGGDVFVRQLAGRKHWTVCDPRPDGCAQCTPAARGLKQELLMHRMQGEGDDGRRAGKVYGSGVCGMHLAATVV